MHYLFVISDQDLLLGHGHLLKQGMNSSFSMESFEAEKTFVIQKLYAGCNIVSNNYKKNS